MTDFCLDNNGNIVVCDDADSARIHAFDYDGNETLSINVSADEQSSDAPHHIVCVYVDAGGLIYAADSGASCVCIYHPDGKLKARFGKHGDGEGEFKGFSSLCVDDGKIYVLDGQTSRTQIFDADGNYMSSFGSNVAPAHLMIHNGQAYAVNHDNHEVEVYSMDGEKQTKTEGGFGEGLEQFWFPSSAAAMKDGSIAISERENHRVKVFKFQ
ncbi:predicted protein [Nematostella vectensis]|uniref:Uncharacterized protein n=2 Tax=Nematostella vectensis TaxID=45351 RepID=A7SJ81_NEMVE|nr:predicted protein [Nematostella vectensis]|eukprot:XP_001628291.1 predicted protein [Nematostella vectensis]